MIIGINGKIGSGKDTVANIICALANENRTLYRWEVRKYATKLKKVASLLTGIPVEKFEDQEFKKTELKKEWDVIGKNNGCLVPMTVRTLLQALGTDAVRKGLHDNAWVNALFADYTFTPVTAYQLLSITDYEPPVEDHYPNWVISDMRFPNEYDAIKDRGGFTIRVVRPDNPYPASSHISETALDDFEPDYIITNDGTLDDLVEKVKAVLIDLKII